MPSSTARCLTECTAQCAAAQCTVAGPVQGRAGCKHPASDGHSTLQSTDNTLMSSINFVNPYTQHCRCQVTALQHTQNWNDAMIIRKILTEKKFHVLVCCHMTRVPGNGSAAL